MKRGESMICNKCNKVIPDDSVFCAYCGKKLVREQPVRRRANGTGTVFKRGSTWSARVTTGWIYEDGKKVQKYSQKGGFRTKTEAEKESRREGERRGAVVFGAFLCRKFNFLLKNSGLF